MFIIADNIKAVKENETGRNTHFNVNGQIKTRATVVKEIKQGQHPNHHVRKINGIDTPVSNPDKTSNNNIER